MSTNRDEAARIITKVLKTRKLEEGDYSLEMANVLLMFEISDSLAEIAKELREINRVKDSPQ